MFTVYVLLSLKDQQHYVGMTNNLTRRFSEHNAGKNKSTKSRLPFLLLYSEQFPSRNEARIRERYLKSAAGRKFLKSILSKQQPSNLPD
jgi:putative endonuclease